MADRPTPEQSFSIAVHQATGMIASQADCGISEALAGLTIRAAAVGQSRHDTALDVLDHVVRFNRWLLDG